MTRLTTPTRERLRRRAIDAASLLALLLVAGTVQAEPDGKTQAGASAPRTHPAREESPRNAGTSVHSTSGSFEYTLELSSTDLSVAERLVVTQTVLTPNSAWVWPDGALSAIEGFRQIESTDRPPEARQDARFRFVRHAVFEPFLAGDRRAPAVRFEVSPADAGKTDSPLPIEVRAIPIHVRPVVSEAPTDIKGLSSALDGPSLVGLPPARSESRRPWSRTVMIGVGAAILGSCTALFATAIARRKRMPAQVDPLARLGELLTAWEARGGHPSGPELDELAAAIRAATAESMLHHAPQTTRSLSTQEFIDGLIGEADIFATTEQRRSVVDALQRLDMLRFAPATEAPDSALVFASLRAAERSMTEIRNARLAQYSTAEHASGRGRA